ncbi:Y-family DNA polymerase [Haematobacter missouriensis]|uniref:DNA-directed DNA polymerase n=1 Tax=Haematobacter missouriensis TaxID=366616 RepID=A0ABX3ZY67_9RHOB|nr:DNA polymerase Y family protein [Haematobacter missouriensis]OWJ79756.1 nucleotidyltransferase [Haematobacter missouriensis]
MARRLLSIWFPRLASDVSLRSRPVEGPFALTLRASNAEQLHCLNLAASQAGLHRGMALADARAICPVLSTRPADPVREGGSLESLRRWAGRYGPQAAKDGTDGLIVDVSGVAHLFGGEEELLADVGARLERAGIATKGAIAETRGGAWALARRGGGVIPEGGLLARLGPMPVSALRIDANIAESLARLGLHRIGDLAGMARAPLAKRFGHDLLRRLDQALGQQAEPVAAEPDPRHFGVRMTLPEPIGLTADVMGLLGRLLIRLCDRLKAEGQGARKLILELKRVDRSAAMVEIGLARAMRDPARISALFLKGVEDVDAGFGIDGLRLSAVMIEPLAPEQIGDAKVRQEDELSDLISRLGNRLGFEAVQRFLPAKSRIPERSFLTVPAAYAKSEPFPERRRPRRPITLFPAEPLLWVSGNPPARFSWRRMSLTTLRAQGPERITPEWWFDDPAWRSGVRDYWRVETQEGPRLWLFRTPQSGDWYAQGVFL